MLMLASLAVLSAWSITDTYFGNKTGALDARSYAMGSTGTYDDLRPFGISLNPANLTLMGLTWGAQGSALIDRNEDNRNLPLYNSFDSYIDDAVYASNINFYYDYAGAGFGSYALKSLRLGLGAYWKPLLSFDGTYLEEIRDNRNTDSDAYPEKIAINSIENKGMLNQTAGVLSLGFKPGENMELDLGVDYSFLRGSIENEKAIRWSKKAIDKVAAVTTDPLPNYSSTEDIDLEGSRLKLGSALRVSNVVGLGLTYTTMATLERTGNTQVHKDSFRNTEAVDDTTLVSEDYILPAEIRLGFNYRPRNIMRTWFNLDVEYVKWSDVADTYDDAFNIYAGVEHFVVNRMPLRLGFQSTTSYFRSGEQIIGDLDSNPETANDTLMVYTPSRYMTPMITAGTSIPLSKRFNLDLGFGYSWREYEALDMFQDTYYNDKLYTGLSTFTLWPNSHIDLRDRGWENPDKVRENNISFNTSLSFTW